MRRLDAQGIRDAEVALARLDPKLGAWMPRIPTPQLTRRHSYFASLCRAIVAQQVSNKAAQAICGRLFHGCGRTRGPTVEHMAALSDDQLRAVGLSRQKVRYIRELTEAFGSGHLKGYRFARRDDGEVIEDLMRVPGVGRWTAEMFLIFSLHRPDVFSAGDLALRNGLMRVDGLRGLSPKQCAQRAERWAPHRSVASLYLWRIAHYKGDVPGGS